jgi:hypothetical protein
VKCPGSFLGGHAYVSSSWEIKNKDAGGIFYFNVLALENDTSLLMKKGLLLLTFLCALTAVHAQIGLRAGLGSANFSNGDSQRAYTSSTTFHLGAYYGFQATEKLVIEPGLFFSRKGYNTIAPGTTTEIDEKLGYLDVPVIVRYSLNSSINVFAGPQAGFLLTRTYNKGNLKDNRVDPIGGYEIGGVMGIGYSFANNLNLQLSYDFGIVPFNYYEFEVNNTVFKLSLGYTLPSKAVKE